MVWRPWTSPFLTNPLMKKLVKNPTNWILIFGIILNVAHIIYKLAYLSRPLIEVTNQITIALLMTMVLVHHFVLDKEKEMTELYKNMAEDAIDAVDRANGLTRAHIQLSKATIDDLRAENDALKEVIKTYQEAGKKPVKRNASRKTQA